MCGQGLRQGVLFTHFLMHTRVLGHACTNQKPKGFSKVTLRADSFTRTSGPALHPVRIHSPHMDGVAFNLYLQVWQDGTEPSICTCRSCRTEQQQILLRCWNEGFPFSIHTVITPLAHNAIMTNHDPLVQCDQRAR